MNAPPEQIEREIEATRAELDRTLAALEAKLSVRRRVDHLLSSARENGVAAAGAARDVFRDYRTPIVAVGASVAGLLIARGLARRR